LWFDRLRTRSNVDLKICGTTLWPIVPTILQGGFLKTLEEQCKSLATLLCYGFI